MNDGVISILTTSFWFTIIIEVLLPVVIFCTCWVIVIYLPKICHYLKLLYKKSE